MLQLINIIHVLFIFFVLIIPFTGNNSMLFIHSITIPFMVFHWILNTNKCALSELEKKIRKSSSINSDEIKDEDCFTCRIINPIYDFKKNNVDMDKLLYLITLFVWLWGLIKLFNNVRMSNANNLSQLLKE
jgi:hypothetical protein